MTIPDPNTEVRNNLTSNLIGAEAGRAARSVVGRKLLGVWLAPSNRRDPVDLLEEEAQRRLPDLVPVRYGRMLASPYAFMRGAAAVMARDLIGQPSTGLEVQLCGDAHLSNFGLFASPERHLRFGINDFDETARGSFEWDLKRLAASIAVVSRQRALTLEQRRSIAMEAGLSYQRHMREMAQMRDTDLWYFHIEDRDIIEVTQRARLNVAAVRKELGRASRRDNLAALNKIATRVDGRLTISPAPPLIVPIPAAEVQNVALNIASYVSTIPAEHQPLIARFTLQDVALKVVGVGSVGTRCWIALFQGLEATDPLFLQVKEAGTSVYSRDQENPGTVHQGERVVRGQKLIQSSGDVFLGWATGRDGRDYYVRQLWDKKSKFDPSVMTPNALRAYASTCAWELARAHARTGDRGAISTYIGKGRGFARSLAQFAESYAEQTENDYACLLAAESSGRIRAERGL